MSCQGPAFGLVMSVVTHVAHKLLLVGAREAPRESIWPLRLGTIDLHGTGAGSGLGYVAVLIIQVPGTGSVGERCGALRCSRETNFQLHSSADPTGAASRSSESRSQPPRRLTLAACNGQRIIYSSSRHARYDTMPQHTPRDTPGRKIIYISTQSSFFLFTTGIPISSKVVAVRRWDRPLIDVFVEGAAAEEATETGAVA